MPTTPAPADPAAADTVEMQIEDHPTVTLGVGDGFLTPPDTPHHALDVGPGTGQVLSVHLVDPSQPVSTPLDAPGDRNALHTR